MKEVQTAVLNVFDENGNKIPIPALGEKEGKYELIETIEGNDGIIDRKKEPDGTPYNFEKIYLEFESYENDVDMYGNITAIIGNDTPAVRLSERPGTNKIFGASFKIENGVCESKLIKPTIAVRPKYTMTGLVEEQAHMTFVNGTINGILTTLALPTTATLKIYGVRA